ncbi:putative beta-ig-h3 fasciclin [Rosellinia necatrix]|uniref:Putative beta-ig-h3 fasciclin n=1 Tax=Rosellinia necatrix TaxID=77044 RepID=A0A1S7UL90_ROSNE|nr:putative beta-ig-h3 fasciclin [Rosellinia necatrix]
MYFYDLILLFFIIPVSAQEVDDSLASLLHSLFETPDTKEFAGLLERHDDFIGTLDNSTNYTIIAPSNDAVLTLSQIINESGQFFRREDSGTPPEVALLFIERGDDFPDLALRQATLRTSLRDPQYVNIGPGEPVKIVSEPDPSDRKRITLTSGLGNTTSVFLENITYPQGNIQLADRYSHTDATPIRTKPKSDVWLFSFLTLPKPLNSTLQETNGTRFRDALMEASLLNIISDTPRITAFVPMDSAFEGVQTNASVLQQHILEDVLGYTPELSDGNHYTTKAGSAVSIFFKSGVYYVNNAKIVHPNVITKNGVIHYIDTFIVPSPATSDTTPQASEPGSSATRIHRSLALMLPLLVAIALSY